MRGNSGTWACRFGLSIGMWLCVMFVWLVCVQPGVMADDSPVALPKGYKLAYETAKREGKAIVIFVGERSRQIPGAVSYQCDSFPRIVAGVVVGRPKEGPKFDREDLATGADDVAIMTAMGVRVEEAETRPVQYANSYQQPVTFRNSYPPPVIYQPRVTYQQPVSYQYQPMYGGGYMSGGGSCGPGGCPPR
jgi:hypothetical protein